MLLLIQKIKINVFLCAIGINVYYEFLNIKNPGNITKKLFNHCEKLNTSNINCPPSRIDIDQFEKDNPQIAVSVFEYKGFKTINGDKIHYSNDFNCCIDVRDANIDDEIDKDINIDKSESGNEDINDNKTNKKRKCIQLSDVRISPFDGKRKYSLNFLIIRDGDNEHYLAIRSISRLFHGSKYDKGVYYCEKCYCSFRSIKELNEKYIPLCSDEEKSLKIMPKKIMILLNLKIII